MWFEDWASLSPLVKMLIRTEIASGGGSPSCRRRGRRMTGGGIMKSSEVEASSYRKRRQQATGGGVTKSHEVKSPSLRTRSNQVTRRRVTKSQEAESLKHVRRSHQVKGVESTSHMSWSYQMLGGGVTKC
ncbi:hypothetical protein RRG08_028597 [Elysia crispata]|uniref:Uncharacterized protein n=1 Tax=Elysia crispata TaxID=231223 RepID=A0AAE0ZT32_9GAST|nr:hypothetical protein RRG08_028597 [Elysia crispata]